MEFSNNQEEIQLYEMSSYVINQLDSLSKLSFVISIISLLIETSNDRSFPSYNLLIGIYGLSFKWKMVPRSAILPAVTCFSTITGVSILLDILYSALWGNEILQGLSKSTKFSFILLILNAFMKTISICYSFSVQIALSLSKEFDLSSRLDISRSRIDSDLSTGEDKSEEDHPSPNSLHSQRSSHPMTPTSIQRDYDSNTDKTIQPDIEMNTTSFTPGIPGLVSPMYPRILSHGWTPPKRNRDD